MKFSLKNKKNLESLISDLMIGLNRLDFKENFQSFEYEATIAAGAEISIKNQLNPAIPRYMMVLKQVGAGQITAGSVAWDRDSLTLKNHGSISLTATVLFIR